MYDWEKYYKETIHLTGHRPQALGGFSPNAPENAWIRETAYEVLEKLKEMGFKRLISGMALGFDQWGLEAAIQLGYFTVAAIPCLEQENIWPAESQKIYHNLLERSNYKCIVSSEKYRVELMQIRNIWMVDRAWITLALYNGQAGGTRNCLNYAVSQGNVVVTMNSKEKTVRVPTDLGDVQWPVPKH